MTAVVSKADLMARMLVFNLTLKNLLQQIKDLENNDQLSANSKLTEIKKIQEEIKKVGMEIDMVKNGITLLNAYNIN
jgi:hypothetical protein